MAKFIELELVVNSQSKKIAELETVYADLKREKEGVASSYWRLFD
jgi:chromosome segregation ATPase